MQELKLFEYAVIRFVPQVEREEFLNIGVVLYCAKERFLKALYSLPEKRLTAFCSIADISEFEAYLKAFERICKGERETGTISRLPVAERFRWLTATRSTIVQTSKVHPGLCADANIMLESLYEKLVL